MGGRSGGKGGSSVIDREERKNGEGYINAWGMRIERVYHQREIITRRIRDTKRLEKLEVGPSSLSPSSTPPPPFLPPPLASSSQKLRQFRLLSVLSSSIVLS